jgi:hypothetical protein
MPVTTPGICPQCGSKGKRVDSATLKTMLSVSLLEVRDTQYWFCRDADCSVVYFRADGPQIFTIEQIRERVFQKEPNADDVLVCYCFRHTPGIIRDEIQTTGSSTVVEEINAGIQAGKCACDWRNPQGSCCLGNVKEVVKRLTTEQQRSTIKTAHTP